MIRAACTASTVTLLLLQLYSQAAAARRRPSLLPVCQPLRSSFDAPVIPTCTQMARVREENNCTSQGTQQCCDVLQALVTARCHCWEGQDAPTRIAMQSLSVQCSETAQQAHVARPARRVRARGVSGVRLFVGVLTTASRKEYRNAIRETWGADRRLYRLVFVVAKPREEAAFAALQEEAAAMADTVVLPTIWEAYHNITHQTLEIMRAAAVDPTVTHVLKVDDDSFVRVGALLRRIQQSPRGPTILGWIEKPGGGPHRNPSSQWFIPKEDWPSERYPPWAHGAGYVVTADLVREIAAGAALQACDHRIFKLEDIAMGSWIEYVAQHKGWDVNYDMDVYFNFHGCLASDIVSHYIKPHFAKCMHDKLPEPACCSRYEAAKFAKQKQESSRLPR